MTTTFDLLAAAHPSRWEPADDGPLFEACRAGDVAAVERLLTHGHSTEGLDGAGFRPLHLASAVGSPAVVERLVAEGAHIDAASAHPGSYGGLRPLHAAVAGHHLVVVERLLALGARVDAVDETGFTPLHLAATLGQLPIARALLKAGADPSREVADTSPVALALRSGHRAVAALLRQCAHVGRLRT